jgi:hypothetical protein
MAYDLTVFKTAFAEEYQQDYYKRSVGRVVANFRFQKELQWGVSVDRKILNMSAIKVRDIVPNVDRTISAVADSKETLTIDKIKGADFRMSDHDVTKDGPLNAARKAAKDASQKLSLYVDGDILAEIKNLTVKFDTGDLSGTASTGVPVSLTSVTVPQMVFRMPAKNTLRNRQDAGNDIFITDTYAASDIAQYVAGKNIDLAGRTFQNGYSGTINDTQVVVSEKLTSDAVMTGAGVFTDGETVTISGVVFTMKNALGATPGQVLIGAALTNSLANLASLINAPGTTTATGVALSALDQATVTDDLRLAATSTATTLSFTGTGAGRLVISETGANFSLTTNTLHSYFGKKGFTDVVMQEEVEMEERKEPKQRTTNFLFDKTYGIKTFADGKVRGLDVLIAG